MLIDAETGRRVDVVPGRTRPGSLTGGHQETLARLEAACPEMTDLAALVGGFAALLAPDPGNAARLQDWITAARAADLPHVHAFTRGLDLDTQAVTAALTLPFHNGRTEGVNQHQDDYVEFKLSSSRHRDREDNTDDGISGCDRSGCPPMAWSVARPRAKAGFLVLAATLGGPGRTRPGLHRR